MMATKPKLPRHKGDRYCVTAPGWHSERFMGVHITYSYRGDRGWMYRCTFGVGAFRRLQASKNSARMLVRDELAAATAQPAIAAVVMAILEDVE